MRFLYETSHAPIEGPVSHTALEVEFESEAQAATWVRDELAAVSLLAFDDRTEGDGGSLTVRVPLTFLRLTRVPE